ncbi:MULTISPECIES: ATP-binding protein [unclassified Bradyrhizobium]|uniref:ATP-binding protein n=1 Tax=unclassified Bradyrhizobium TaxID=2631580 RepID=UPI000413E9D1|nr:MULTISPECIES: ATP-binding protein [unclassified Bradyrhizobium]QIG95280.1 two-component sensor histidine kinase [Bradyrhizobium sp. 6(2017)]
MDGHEGYRLSSLRRRALIWSSLLIIFIAAIVVAAARHVAIVEINKLLDNELQQIAVNAGRGLSEAALGPLRNTEVENRVAVQVWREDGETVHQSPEMDRLPRSTRIGFSDIEAGGHLWRVYTAGDGHLFAQVGQRQSARMEIANHAAAAAGVPLLAAFPLAWIAVILGVDQLLRRLANFSDALAARSVEAKDPVDPGGMPNEFLPIISAINKLIDRYRQAVEQQKQFVSEAAHELRTPLAALQIQIDNLHRQSGAAFKSEILSELSQGIRRASAMVGQLLRMARLDGPMLHHARAEIDLKGVMLSVVSEFVPTSARCGVELDMSLNEDVRIEAYDAELRLLFANLIDNAVRYTPFGGSVEVSIAKSNSAISVRILDSGIGIPEHALPRIFDRFYRAAPVDIEGTGLGLAIARKVAQRNNMTLTVENRRDGRGVLAQVDIPVAG